MPFRFRGRLSFILMIIIMSWTSSCPPALGASSSGTGLQVSPAIVEPAVQAGQSVGQEVFVTNLTSHTFAMHLHFDALETDQTSGSTDNRFNASSWITVPRMQFPLDPGKPQSIKFTVTAPANATPGGHYATAIFEAVLSQPTSTGTQATVVARVGVQILILVAGTVDERLVVESPLRANVHGDQVRFSFSVRNKGNIHVLPTGTLTIRARSGGKVKTLALQPSLVLPDTTKQYLLTWKTKDKFARYDVTLHVKYGDNKSLPVMKVSVFKYDHFIAFLIVALIVVLIAVFIFWRYRRRQRRDLSLFR